MPTLTATVNASAATVRLVIDEVTGVTGLLRSDSNGTRPVRLRDRALSGTGPRTLTDYEPCMTGWVQYHLEHPSASTTAWVDLAAATGPRFTIPAVPQLSVAVESVSGYEASRDSTATFHQVIDRSSPLVAEGRMGTRSGKLTAIFRSYPEASALALLLGRGQTLMFRQKEHPGLDMYFNAPRYGLQGDPETGLWTADIEFIELSFPPGNVTSRSGWTFEALAAEAQSFGTLPGDYDTFQDVVVGRAR